MSLETITFQLATHFLSKIALRLEYLFLTIEDARKESHPIIHHYALNNIIEIITLIEKPELKSRFLKEFMRIEHYINKVETTIPHALYARLFVQIQLLNQVLGRFGEGIHQTPFLQSVRLAQRSHSNDYELHSPELFLWLETPPSKRQHDLSCWMKQLRTLYDTVIIYLSLIRETATFDRIDLINGYFQRPLPSKTTCHLILLKMDKSAGIVPKMQLGHHGLSLRLYDAYSIQEVRHTDTVIDLAICQL